MTNGDKVRKMNDEELATFLMECANDCIDAYYSNWLGPWAQYEGNMKWLKHEVDAK